MVDLRRYENRYYPEPKEKAQNIKDYVAFYKVATLLMCHAPAPTANLKWIRTRSPSSSERTITETRRRRRVRYEK